MTSAHFIAVTTNEIGPAGPAKQIFAAAFETPEEALEVVTAKLKPGLTAALWQSALGNSKRSTSTVLCQFGAPPSPMASFGAEPPLS